MNAPMLCTMVILVLFSAFFSGAETAFTSFNRVKLKSMMRGSEENKKKNRKIENALKFAEDYDMVLSSILIGNNIVNIVSTSIATLFFTGLLGDNSDLGATVSTIVMTVTVLIFGEISPKTIAKKKAESFVIIMTPAVKFFVVIFTPLNFFFKQWKLLLNKLFGLDKIDTVTEEELKTYIDEAETSGEIDENESELIRSSIEFDDIDVGDILVPRIDVEAVDKYAPLDDIERIFNTTNFSRLPVYIGDIDNIVGVIHHRDFENARKRNLKSLRTVLKPVPAVSPDTKISKLLRILQKNKTHLAVVIDEFGGTEGIVTLEDILEELVGEIWDEHDEVQNDFEKIGDNEYIVYGSASIDDFKEFFDIYQKTDYISTVNGWVLLNTDKIPEVGDSFISGNLTAQVLTVDGKRADKIKITVKEDEDAFWQEE
ncbi:MAG: hemolysin family protein [Clostridiales bacterium]|nr:hemolysin family protein [Clostridiales bacterium]